MTEPTRIEALQAAHWEESLLIGARLVKAAEMKLGELTVRYSGQLSLFEIDDERA